LTFYLFLMVLIDWPASLFMWDLLFLVPLPWLGAVMAPYLVAASMVWPEWWCCGGNWAEGACARAPRTGWGS
jgi:hypothetical protein